MFCWVDGVPVVLGYAVGCDLGVPVLYSLWHLSDSVVIRLSWCTVECEMSYCVQECYGVSDCSCLIETVLTAPGWPAEDALNQCVSRKSQAYFKIYVATTTAQRAAPQGFKRVGVHGGPALSWWGCWFHAGNP